LSKRNYHHVDSHSQPKVSEYINNVDTAAVWNSYNLKYHVTAFRLFYY